ncbi:MAG: hypothetical protein HC854_16635 [Flavobacterium sp.]|nr:hypothetical protein [Flavobacterium sp.]
MIQSLDLRNNKLLTGINCSRNNITSLNIDGLKNIRELNCNENKIDKLNMQYNLGLEQLYCANNVLTELNCNNINLKYLTCNNNKLSILHTGNIKAIIEINCSYNKLTELHLENCFFLKELECSNNFITELKVENANSLIKLDCSFNGLKSLQVNSCLKLSYLICNSNELEELNVTENKELRELIVNSNRLSRLNLSLNPKLTKIYCSDNNLRELDIANGNNLNITQNRASIFSKYSNNFKAFNNPDLFCIQVDDLNYGVYENFWDKDEHTYFSEDCKTFIKPDTIYRKDRERYSSLLVEIMSEYRGLFSLQYIEKKFPKKMRESEIERLRNVQNGTYLKEIQFIIDSIGTKNLGDDVSRLLESSISNNIPLVYKYLIESQKIDFSKPYTYEIVISASIKSFWSAFKRPERETREKEWSEIILNNCGYPTIE